MSNEPSKPLPTWKKYALIGAGVGAGTAVAVAIIIGVAVWYSSRPKAWDNSVIRASFTTFSIDVVDDKEITGMELEYVIENTSREDYTLSPDQQFMLVDDGALRTSSTGKYKVSKACFVPGGNKVKCKIAVPADFDTSFGVGGFVVFDKSTRYKVVFPAPTMPTPDDRKKMLMRFTMAKEDGSSR